MVWHILKKDWRLLWQFALTVVVTQFALAATDLQLGHFHRFDPAPRQLQLVLERLVYFGTACFIIALIHQDALVDVRKDWLVRPIRRRDLLASKLTFILLVIQVPLLVAELGEGLAAGFPFRHALSAALSENAVFLIGLTLPVLAIAVITRSLAQAIASSLAVLIVFSYGQFMLRNLAHGNGLTAGSAVEWVSDGLRMLVCLVGVTLVVVLQYFRRRTRSSTVMLGMVLALCLLVQLIPWKYAFRAQAMEHNDRAVSNLVSLRFTSSKSALPSSSIADPTAALRNADYSKRDGDMRIALPIEVAGMPEDSILRIDRAVVHLIPPDGTRPVPLEATATADSDVEITSGPETPTGSNIHAEPIKIRASVYRRWMNVPVSIAIDYSITLLETSSVHEIPAIEGDGRFPDAGWCKSALDEDEGRVEIEARCLQAGFIPQCATFLLVDPATGAHNPIVHGCRNDYSPWFGRYTPLSTISVSAANLRFRDPGAIVHYPVDASKIKNAKVVIRSYQPVAHFERLVTLSNIRIADWVSE
jgi:hypothetical protein